MKIPFFRSATFEAIQQICSVAQERKFLSGEIIFRRGEISTGLYLVRTGTIVITPLSYTSGGGSVRRNRWHEDLPSPGGGIIPTASELRDDGTRPMKVSFLRMRRKAKNLRKSFLSRSVRGGSHRDSSTVYPLSSTGFPVTAGSWFGECELLREIVLGGDARDYRRTTTVEAKTNVRLLFISKEDLSKVLYQHPQILMELLICHSKRYSSPDLPHDIREAFRFSDEWEMKVVRVVDEISRARQVDVFASPGYPVSFRSAP
jgi:CRP-like cAMP-binding protein